MNAEAFPEQSQSTIRRKLNNRLESIKLMLVHKRSELPLDEWENFAIRTRDGILNQPEQYLDRDITSQSSWRTIFGELFEEFLKREKSEHPRLN